MLTLWLADKILSDLEGEEDLKLAMNMRKTIDILLFDLLYEILNAKPTKKPFKFPKNVINDTFRERL